MSILHPDGNSELLRRVDVSYRADGLNDDGLSGRMFYFLTQSEDMLIESAGIWEVVTAPAMVEQSIAGDRLPCVKVEGMENGDFSLRERDRCVISDRSESLRFNLEIAHSEWGARLFGDPSESSTYASHDFWAGKGLSDEVICA